MVQGCHVSEGANYLFEVATPLGFSVRTTGDYWLLLRPSTRSCAVEPRTWLNPCPSRSGVPESGGSYGVPLFTARISVGCVRCGPTLRRRGVSHHRLSLCDKIQGRKTGYGLLLRASTIPIGETLTVYWDDPEHEEVCEGGRPRDHPDQRRTRRGIGFERFIFQIEHSSA